jgi:hypothetical protein
MAIRDWLPDFLIRTADQKKRSAAWYRRKFAGTPAEGVAKVLATDDERQAKTLLRAAKSKNERDMRKAYNNLLGSNQIANIQRPPRKKADEQKP